MLERVKKLGVPNVTASINPVSKADLKPLDPYKKNRLYRVIKMRERKPLRLPFFVRNYIY